MIKNSCSYFFENLISKNNEILNFDPIYFFKAIKGKKEIENIKKAHVSDGASFNKIFIMVKKKF